MPVSFRAVTPRRNQSLSGVAGSSGPPKLNTGVRSDRESSAWAAALRGRPSPIKAAGCRAPQCVSDSVVERRQIARHVKRSRDRPAKLIHHGLDGVGHEAGTGEVWPLWLRATYVYLQPRLNSGAVLTLRTHETGPAQYLHGRDLPQSGEAVLSLLAEPVPPRHQALLDRLALAGGPAEEQSPWIHYCSSPFAVVRPE